MAQNMTTTKPRLSAKPKAPKTPRVKKSPEDMAEVDLHPVRPRCVVSFGSRYVKDRGLVKTAMIIDTDGRTRHLWQVGKSGMTYGTKYGSLYDLTGMSATKPTMTEKSGPSKPRRRRRR